jgi:hypothetical protein
MVPAHAPSPSTQPGVVSQVPSEPKLVQLVYDGVPTQVPDASGSQPGVVVHRPSEPDSSQV